MKTTAHRKGRRWTTEELRSLIAMWQEDADLPSIAEKFQSTEGAILRQVGRMRADGIPLSMRTRGKNRVRSRNLWTQEEVEYLFRRRLAGASAEEIANDLGRSYNAVHAMIGTLRKKGVPVAMRGTGVKRLWDPEALKSAVVGRFDPYEVQLAEKMDDKNFLQSVGIAEEKDGESVE